MTDKFAEDDRRPVKMPAISVEPVADPSPDFADTAAFTALTSFRALILEDEEFQRQIGVQILKGCRASEVLSASDGATALRLIKSAPQPIDLLICDLTMPDMDGLEFLRHLAEGGNTSSVILCSSLAPSIIRAAELMARIYGVRILGVIEKPLSLPKLIPLLLHHFSQTASTSSLPNSPIPLDEIIAGIENWQFLPFFQPKVDIQSGALVGAEALIRWNHPEHGLILPERFIPITESHGLISEVTLKFVKDALNQCRRWHDMGMGFPISVNVSVESLSDTGLADRLEAMTRAEGVSPDALTLEITETVAMANLGPSLETLARCRMKGFDLSIDDYGTGFSSMLQLTRLPISEIKIDQSFVTGAARQNILQALIETSLTMARRLNLKTVVEGVETLDDWRIVSSLGCDIAQGYFIAKPMPGEDLAGWHANWCEFYKGLRLMEQI